jgi:hypothetical protein
MRAMWLMTNLEAALFVVAITAMVWLAQVAG